MITGTYHFHPSSPQKTSTQLVSGVLIHWSGKPKHISGRISWMNLDHLRYPTTQVFDPGAGSGPSGAMSGSLGREIWGDLKLTRWPSKNRPFDMADEHLWRHGLFYIWSYILKDFILGTLSGSFLALQFDTEETSVRRDQHPTRGADPGWAVDEHAALFDWRSMWFAGKTEGLQLICVVFFSADHGKPWVSL